MRVVFDYETRSACDLRKCGAAAYAEHPSTDVICCAVKVDNEKPKLWFPAWSWNKVAGALTSFESEAPFTILSDEELFHLFAEAEEIECHNAFFETCITCFCCEKKYGWPPLPQEKLRCSLAKCSYHALPRSLEQACQALEVAVQKDMEGSKLMLRMCRPKRPVKAEVISLREQGFIVHDKTKEIFDGQTGEQVYLWHEAPEQITRLAQYCAQDTEAEYALSSALPDLPPSELTIWQLDAKINMRGIAADIPAATRFVEEIGKLETRLLAETKEVTNGAVGSPKQVAQALKWLAEQGVVLPDLTKNSVAAALKDENAAPAVRHLLALRQQLGRASTAKYQAIINAANEDGRIRGTLLYHGCSTGRWSGKLVQPQNLYRGSFSDAGACIEVTMEHGFGMVEMLWGDLMGAAATCIRGMLTASPGNELVSADFSAIEARVNAWVAGESTVLDAFVKKLDLYKVAASQMFNKPVSEVSKQERQIGKTVELACIAEDQLVLTDAGLVPIQEVTLEHTLWDGEEFVAHGGVICQGRKPVIQYDGLTATSSHIVWAEVRGEQRQVPFGFAAASRSHLVQSGAGGNPVRLGGDNFPGETVHQGVEPTVCSCTLCKLRQNELGVPLQLNAGKEQGLPKLLLSEAHPQVAGQTDNGHAAAMHEPERCRVGELRGSGHPVQVCGDFGSRSLDNGELRTPEGNGAGPDRQRRALRAGESPLCNTPAECSEQEVLICDVRRVPVGGSLQPLRIQKDLPLLSGWALKSADTGTCEESCEGEAQELARNKEGFRFLGSHRVYDILNCGPRNRFTVSGRLVHNCGYQGGIGAYTAMAKNYGIDLESLPEFILPVATEDDLERATNTASGYLKKNPGAMSLDAAVACDIIKQLWRQKRPNIVGLWRGLEEACLLAVKNPGKAYKYRCVAYKSDGRFLRCKLPSGRYLHYFKPGLQVKTTPWGQQKEVVTYYGVDSVTHKFTRAHIYGGSCCENVIQAIARDLMAEAMLRCEAAGYPTVLSVHDELLADTPKGFGGLKEFESLMSKIPEWAKGYFVGDTWWGVECPVAAEGWVGKRYRK